MVRVNKDSNTEWFIYYTGDFLDWWVGEIFACENEYNNFHSVFHIYLVTSNRFLSCGSNIDHYHYWQNREDIYMQWFLMELPQFCLLSKTSMKLCLLFSPRICLPDLTFLRLMNSSFFWKGNNLWLSNVNCLCSIKWQCYKVVKFTASRMWRSVCGRVVLCGNIIDQ